jgi:hypothetical protein
MVVEISHLKIGFNTFIEKKMGVGGISLLHLKIFMVFLIKITG